MVRCMQGPRGSNCGCGGHGDERPPHTPVIKAGVDSSSLWQIAQMREVLAAVVAPAAGRTNC